LSRQPHFVLLGGCFDGDCHGFAECSVGRLPARQAPVRACLSFGLKILPLQDCCRRLFYGIKRALFSQILIPHMYRHIRLGALKGCRMGYMEA
jgi:hypothetical protein